MYTARSFSEGGRRFGFLVKAALTKEWNSWVHLWRKM